MAEDRSINEVFQYESKKRSTVEGISLAALGGDRNALKSFAGLAREAIELPGSEELKPAGDWLGFVLSQIESGVEPNVAFGWARKRRGAPSPAQDFEGLMKQWLVGQHMAGLVSSGVTQRAAALQVSVARSVSESEAIRCYRAFSASD